MSNKPQSEAPFYKVVMFVSADQFPALYEVASPIAAVITVEHWYQSAEGIAAGEGQTSTEVVHDGVPDGERNPKRDPKGNPIEKGSTLVDHILVATQQPDGISRRDLKHVAERNGFNVGSVSPTLVKLMAAKKIKRIGKGIYAFRKTQR